MFDPVGKTGYVRIVFSRHALRRIRERGFSVEDVLETLDSPRQLLYDRWRDLYIYVGDNGSAVVCAYRGSCFEIVTVLGRREFKALFSKYGISRYKVIV